MLTPTYNKSTLTTIGDKLYPRRSGGIKHRTYSEGYFMQKSPLAKDYIAPDKTNPIIRFFKGLYETMREIIDATKTDNTKM